MSRGQLLFKLDDQSYRLALVRLEAEIEIGARRDPRPARAMARQARGDQGGAQPADLCRGRVRAADRAWPRRRSPRPRSSRRRASRSTWRASASRRRRRTCTRIEAALAGDPQDPHRRSSQGQADDGGARRGAAAASPHHHRGAARRHRRQAAGAGQLRHRRRAGDGRGGRHRPLDRGQLQGDRAHARAAGPEGRDPRRHLSRRRVHRHGGEHRRRRPARSSPCCRRRTPAATG